MKARRFFAFVAGAAMLFGVGCTPDNGGNNGGDEALAEITVSPASFATDLEGGEQVIAVTSNATWTVSCDQADVTIEPLTGNGNGSVTITVPAASAREFKVVFDAQKQTFIPALGTSTTTTAKAELVVSQNATGTDQNNFLYYEKCGEDAEEGEKGWPYVDQFTGWTPEGPAATNVTYTGQSASVRCSGQKYQPTEDAVGISGQPYVFLNKIPASAYFVIENIAVTGGTNYIFNFNVQCQNGYSGSPTFATVDNALVHLELGYDGENWDAVDCAFAANGGNGWYAASAEFKVKADATVLYARFTYEAPAKNGGGRFDDFKLVEGGNGAELNPEAPVVAETTIADIKAAGNYTVKNAWAVATYADGSLLTDASGAYILAYKPTTAVAVGEKVNISGAVSAYAGLLQFGAGAETTKTGETVTVTNPTPVVLDAAKVDALISSIKIQYVQYEGTLTISSGKFYNVTIAGTSNQGSVQYPAEDLKTTLTSLDGKYIKVTGYSIGVSQSKYLNTMAVSVEEATAPETPENPGGGETPETPDTPETPVDGGLVIAASDIATVVQEGTYKLTNGTEQKVDTESTWFNLTANGLSLTGCRVLINNNKEPYKGQAQFQGDASDVSKQGFIGNTLAYNDKEIEKIVVEAFSTYDTPSFNIYYGAEKLPNTNAIATTANNCVKGASAGKDGNYEAFAFTCTFDIPAGNKFFALRNDSKGATYVKSITIVFKE